MLKKFMRSWLPFLLVLLLVPAALYLPDLWALQCENKLLGSPKERPSMEGMLSEKAQDIPILYTLYRNRYLDSRYETVFSDISSKEGIWQLSNILMLLQDNDLLDIEFVDLCLQSIDTYPQNSLASLSEGQGIRGLSISLFINEACTINISANSYIETDQILHFSVRCNQDPLPLDSFNSIPEGFLQRYCSYLGLDVLTDWKVPISSDPNISAIWSEEGQVYLFYSLQNGFSFGAISFSPEDFRGIEFKEPDFK